MLFVKSQERVFAEQRWAREKPAHQANITGSLGLWIGGIWSDMIAWGSARKNGRNEAVNTCRFIQTAQTINEVESQDFEFISIHFRPIILRYTMFSFLRLQSHFFSHYLKTISQLFKINFGLIRSHHQITYRPSLENGSDQLMWHYIHNMSIPLYTNSWYEPFSRHILYILLISCKGESSTQETEEKNL